MQNEEKECNEQRPDFKKVWYGFTKKAIVTFSNIIMAILYLGSFPKK